MFFVKSSYQKSKSYKEDEHFDYNMNNCVYKIFLKLIKNYNEYNQYKYNYIK